VIKMERGENREERKRGVDESRGGDGGEGGWGLGKMGNKEWWMGGGGKGERGNGNGGGKR